MKEVTVDELMSARIRLVDLLEELSAAGTHLREGFGDLQRGNERGCAMSIEDAVGALGVLEAEASKLAASLQMWLEAEGGEG